ncbi:hypothetical protein ACQUQU_10160 [Thalassolituus sp. LLYu03]|uniref:hypothetical protein n=1 Tax=Thalassolituus sp. LLYu03 TaxID=3421656 RepID=UPI003D2E56DB
MKYLKKISLIVAVILLSPFFIYFGLAAKSYFDGCDLKVSDQGIPSRYVFNFSGRPNVSIDDKFNKFVRSWGSCPEGIEIVNGVRRLIFTDSAILKTGVDSIEPHDDYVKVNGYMGIITQDTEFTVNTEGVVSSNKWHGG